MDKVAHPADVDEEVFARALERAREFADHPSIVYFCAFLDKSCVFRTCRVVSKHMAITKGAKKALRQSVRRKAQNDKRKAAIKGAFKSVRSAQKGDLKALAAAYQAIDKALKTGVLKKNTAA